MSQGEQPIELSKAKIAALAIGLLGVIAAAVAATVVIEHKLHGHDDEHHEGRAAHGHGEHEHGDHEHEGPKSGEHADEHEAGKIKLTPAMRENAGLELRTAAAGKVLVTLSLPGEVTLNAEAVAHVTPRVGGTAREVKKQLGDKVKKGDVLAIIDSRELAEMQRELLAAKERLTLAEGTFKRQELLWKEKLSSEQDHLAAKQALAEARIDHRSAAQKLSAAAGAGGGGTSYRLIAPLDGTIIEKHISVGEVLKDDTQAFFLADLSTVWVNVTVYAKDLARIQVGQEAQVRAEGIESPARGTITYLGAVVGEQTRSATARVVLHNPGSSWRPGLFVTADVAIDTADAAVVVDDDAIQTIKGSEVVFVEEGDSFEARPVKLGRHGSSADAEARRCVEILEGVAAGERYVSKNSFLLKAELGKSEAGHDH